MHTLKSRPVALTLLISAVMSLELVVPSSAQVSVAKTSAVSTHKVRSGKVPACILKGKQLKGAVFIAPYKSQATFTVYQASYKSQSDLAVYSTSYKSQASACGLWNFVKYKSQADFSVYFVDYKSQANFSIYFVDYKSQAGVVR